MPEMAYRFSSAPSKRGAVGSPGRAWPLAALTVVLAVTLVPMPGELRPGFFADLVPPTGGGWLDVFTNIALYVPLGLVLAARRISRWGVCLPSPGAP